eukprot:1321784-Amorphochlora_amoeboformis.AAC.1
MRLVREGAVKEKTLNNDSKRGSTEFLPPPGGAMAAEYRRSRTVCFCMSCSGKSALRSNIWPRSMTNLRRAMGCWVLYLSTNGIFMSSMKMNIRLEPFGA